MELYMNKPLSALAAIALFISAQPAFTAAKSDANARKLDTILEAQTDATKARYQYRHPKETLMFFGIKPGMTVLEALPGEGWYSKILLPYLGKEGHLIGVDYPEDMWSKFDWTSKDFLEARRKWPATWPEEIKGWNIADAAQASAYNFKTLPQDLTGKADAALFIRALHNMWRFDSEGGYLGSALQETYRVLKPGGILGVVQHETGDKKATGVTGYLERDSLVKKIEAAGFKLVDESDINKNPKDQPGPDDIVWRLPPTLKTSEDNEKLRNEYLAIGESNRMTLKFIKPAKE
jgi:predicted methyltransferase